MDSAHAVVVSHAAADNALCTPYVAALQAMGIDLYYQPDMPQFGYLSAEVQQELRERKNLLVLLTQNAIESFWVKREMKTFLDLMKDDNSRKMILAQIAPCQVQTGASPNVILIAANEMPFDQAVDTIASALGKAILTTESPAAASRRAPRLSRRGLLAAGLAGAVALGGGAWWFTQAAPHSTTVAGTNTSDPGTPLLTWTPFGGNNVTFPLKYQVPFTAIDLIDLYRIDTAIGGFSFDEAAGGSSDPSVGCVISDIPLIFGSRYHSGEYFVVTSRCFAADANPAPTTGPQPLDSLVVTYIFGRKGASAPCGIAGDGTHVCLPTDNAALIQQVSDAEALATVTAYYATIRRGRYQDAYDLLGRAAQARQTIADFTQHWQVGPITLQPDFSAVGQNGDGTVTLALSYTQQLAEGASLWRATVTVQYEGGQLRVLPLSRYKIIASTTPTPAATGTPPQ